MWREACRYVADDSIELQTNKTKGKKKKNILTLDNDTDIIADLMFPDT